MRSLRLVLAGALALLGAGTGGAISHAGDRPAAGALPGRRSAATTSTTSTTLATPAPTGPVGAGPTSAQLSADLIDPTDMGGYYRVEPTYAASFVEAAACLAGLEPSGAVEGRALTALLGPDAGPAPTIVEVADSYPGSAGGSVFRAESAALAACTRFPIRFDGDSTVAAVQPVAIPPVGAADVAYQGGFSAAGSQWTFDVGVVLQGQVVLAVVFVQSVPAANPIMGGFTSTLSLAIGKLA